LSYRTYYLLYKDNVYFIIIFFLHIFLRYFLFVIIEQIHSISAESPNVEIFPECGGFTDHRAYFTVNGFNPNGNVHWEFINSKGNIDSYGYFETNEFGSFNDFIIADEMTTAIYILRFFDDKNNNFIIDPNGSEVIIIY
jgi:hypothetical protein